MTQVQFIPALLPDGSLPSAAVGHVNQLIDQRAATVVAAGRPDIPATTPYSSAQLAAMPSGTVYRSTDGPQGAWEWAKRGAVWLCVSGDTGWVDIAPINGWEVDGTMRIRRIDSLLVFQAQTVIPTNATHENVCLLPAGLHPIGRTPAAAMIESPREAIWARCNGIAVQVDWSTNPSAGRLVTFTRLATQSWPIDLSGV